MDPDRFIQRCWFLIASPEKEWYLIRIEKIPVLHLYFQFALPLIVLGSITMWAGSFFNTAVLWESLSRVLFQSVFLIVFTVGLYFIIPWFNGKNGWMQAFQLSIFSLAIVWLTDIPGNLTFLLSWMKIFGLYALYVIYCGLRPVAQVPLSMLKPCFIIIVFWLLLTYFTMAYIAGLLPGLLYAGG